ncbi:MAG: alpha/beta hydrolase [Candidatus Thermoplasmatota archaeon]|nr:alpha/beta hydrolase [Candidatus Thermoplasmatota archaeon]
MINFQTDSRYYVHGYLSSPDGSKGSILKEKLSVEPITYRDVPAEQLVISNCLDEIKKVIGHKSDVVLIGSSLGGCLVSKLVLEIPNQIKQIILLNPAIIPPDVDLSTIPDMPLRILKEMKDDRLFNEKLDTITTIFSATNDTVVPPEWVLQFARKQEATVQFLHDDHRFSQHLSQLPEIIFPFL